VLKIFSKVPKNAKIDVKGIDSCLFFVYDGFDARFDAKFDAKCDG
jgi:hypothetical protein